MIQSNYAAISAGGLLLGLLAGSPAQAIEISNI